MKEEDFELLVKIAAREQRYACRDWVENPCAPPDVIEKAQADIQNAPCPEAPRVLALWRKELSRKALTSG